MAGAPAEADGEDGGKEAYLDKLL
jgi:protein KRI1